MTFQFKKTSNSLPSSRKKMKKGWKITLIVLGVLVVVGAALAWKTGFILNKISTRGNIFSSIIKSLPGTDKTLKGEAEGRINVLLLGMRGEGVPGGGLLADTIMLLSLHLPKDETDQAKASLVSIPRDLYVKMPGREEHRKINALYALGEEGNRHSGGMEAMETIVGEVTGQPIHYALVIDFQGFIDLVNAIGGIDVTLSEPFNESQQFHEPQVCDPYVYTIPTKPPQFESKYHTRQDGSKYLTKSYPLCFNKSEECGGNFSLPGGANHLDGKTALCYARSRYASSDFDRARRQQVVIQSLKDKALSVGTLADFTKLNAILDSLGDNVLTDLESWELKRFYDLHQKLINAELQQKVLENSEEGLLYNPPATKESGYILLPRGDNYERIHGLFQSLP